MLEFLFGDTNAKYLLKIGYCSIQCFVSSIMPVNQINKISVSETHFIILKGISIGFAGIN